MIIRLCLDFRAFKPPRSEVSLFRKGMKLEAVDKRNPSLIRVASIADVLMHQIKVRSIGITEINEEIESAIDI